MSQVSVARPYTYNIWLSSHVGLLLSFGKEVVDGHRDTFRKPFDALAGEHGAALRQSVQLVSLRQTVSLAT
jgi:hypothetical protein